MKHFACGPNEIETMAAEMCRWAGGDWNRKRTRKALWRRRAEALIHLANGDSAKAEEAMRRKP